MQNNNVTTMYHTTILWKYWCILGRVHIIS